MDNNFTVQYDPDNHRIAISPLNDAGGMEIATIFRRVCKGLHWSYREVANFTGLKNANRAFRIAYLDKKRVMDDITRLKEYVDINAGSNTAYLYHVDHKPDSVVKPTHKAVTVTNGEPAGVHVTAGVATRLTSRVTITDPLERMLTLTATPTNGALVVPNVTTLVIPNAPTSIRATASKLNKFLDAMTFTGTTDGEGTITITVDDGEGEIASIKTVTIEVTVDPVHIPSVPELTVPENPSAVLNIANKFTAITVSDADNKAMNITLRPHGCDVFGFKSNIFTLRDTEYRTISGVPQYINDEIAKLQVVPRKTTCSLGVDLQCGIYKTHDHVIFKVSPNTSGGGTDDSGGSTDETLTLVISSKTVSGSSSAEVPLGVSFSGSRTEPFKCTLTPTNCKLKDMKAEPGLTGNPYAINAIKDNVITDLADAKIVIGDGNGQVQVTTDTGLSDTITVTNTSAPAALARMSVTPASVTTTTTKTTPTTQTTNAKATVVTKTTNKSKPKYVQK